MIAMTFVVGVIFLPETRGVDLEAEPAVELADLSREKYELARSVVDIKQSDAG